MLPIANRPLTRLTLCLAVCAWLASCATAPLTGRRQLNLMSEAQLATMSAEQYQGVLKKAKISTNREQTAMTRKVGQDLARAAATYLREVGQSAAHYKWEFNLIEDDKTINAWCMPGGKVAVYTGILPVAEGEEGLAVVMGHEIAHAIARHGNERMSASILAEMGAVALSVAVQEKPERTQELFMLSYGVAAQYGALYPYSRVHESEADRIGLTLMAMAGYDPRAAVPFWGRMNKASAGSRPPEFLSTHPAPQTRIRDIESHLPEALARYKR